MAKVSRKVVRLGYSDGSGPEYITIGNKPVLTLRWGCSCCKDVPDDAGDLTAEEKKIAKVVIDALSKMMRRKK